MKKRKEQANRGGGRSWITGRGRKKSGKDGGEERKKQGGNERLMENCSGTLTSHYFAHCCIYRQHSHQTKQLSVKQVVGLTPSAEALLLTPAPAFSGTIITPSKSHHTVTLSPGASFHEELRLCFHGGSFGELTRSCRLRRG